MSNDGELPSYASLNVPQSDLPPLPEYTSPEVNNAPSYRVGSQSIPALVSVSEVKSYLLLLAAFANLKTSVEGAEWDFGSGPPPLKEAKWALFVERAVWRFVVWMDMMESVLVGEEESARVRTSLVVDEIPPLDVLMVLHTFMLDPIAYHETLSRTFPSLTNPLSSFPLALVVSQISMDTLTQVPTPTQGSLWEASTHFPFTLPMSTKPKDTIPITCPSCKSVMDVPWLTVPTIDENIRSPKGVGYAQRGFVTTCQNETCSRSIDKDALRVARFLKDLAKAASDAERRDRPTASESSSLPFVCASTLINPVTGVLDTTGKPQNLCLTVILELVEVATKQANGNLTKNISVSDLGEVFHWKLEEIRNALLASKELSGPEAAHMFGLPRVNPLINAYSTHHPFPIDLVASTLRLATFPASLPFEYLKPGAFNLDNSPLTHAIERYHNFLSMHGSQTSSANGVQFARCKIYVPTVDIDLVWHTHMLRAAGYRNDLLKLLGRVLKHEDQIEEGKLNSRFDETSLWWKNTHKSPYSSCPCIYSSSSSSSSKAQITNGSTSSNSSIKFWKKKTASPSTSLPPGESSSSLYDPNFEHPSDHNSTIVTGIERLELTRTQRLERFQSKLEKKASNGVTMKHERAFGRHIDDGLVVGNERSWDLSAPLDPRTVDGRIAYNRCQVDGIEPPAGLNTLFKPGAFGSVGISRAAGASAILPSTGAW